MAIKQGSVRTLASRPKHTKQIVGRRFYFLDDYRVGSTIRYRTIGGSDLRTVVVTSRRKNIKNGRPGFEGLYVGATKATVKVVGPLRASDGNVWGYDEDIVKIVKY